ncbi:alpha/beta hydrolase [Aureivirga marina]|uniref:alpha/beta hydrolase n=1 Tax=Aureivirga marina TaxID=1182451 RepID=UPI0018C93CEC|nr:alpha/beta hydrolase-fold protein [Aureivirga marina]
MKKLIFCILLIFNQFLIFGQLPKQLSENEFSIGKSIIIESKILNENRNINIYLPPSYSEEKAKSFPVIYLLDGSKDEDFIHVSGIVQFGSFPWINMLPESIVVGIGNVDRKRDFTYPSENKLDQKEYPTSGKSESFIQFIEKELQPYVNSNFKTNKIKTIIGQSLGGLLTTEILLKKPNLFDNYIIVSPSLWWDDEKLLDYKQMVISTKKSIYIAVGKEGNIMERTAKELYTKLAFNNPKTYFEFLENKSHGDALHEAVYHAFEKIFKKK